MFKEFYFWNITTDNNGGAIVYAGDKTKKGIQEEILLRGFDRKLISILLF